MEDSLGLIHHLTFKTRDNYVTAWCIYLLCVVMVTSDLPPPPWRPIPEWSVLQKDHYPNPRTQPGYCGPQLNEAKEMLWCDPNNMTNKEQASLLNKKLDEIHSNGVTIAVAIMKKMNIRPHFTQDEITATMANFTNYFLSIWLANVEQGKVVILVSVVDNLMYASLRVKDDAMISSNDCKQATERLRSLPWDNTQFYESLVTSITVYVDILNETHNCTTKSHVALGKDDLSSEQAMSGFALTIGIIVAIIVIAIVIAVVLLYRKYRLAQTAAKDSVRSPLQGHNGQTVIT